MAEVAVLKTLFQRELLLAFRNKSQLLNPILFFLITVSLFPLATDPSAQTLHLLGPGVIAVAALLATLLSIDGLLQHDYRTGCLEQWLLSSHELSYLIFIKLSAAWLVLAAPLVLVAPCVALFYQLSSSTLLVMVLTLLPTTLLLVALCGVGAAFTVGLRQANLLLPLLVLPLAVPCLIFASQTLLASQLGLPIVACLSLLTGFALLGFIAAPFIIAAVLRIGLV